MTGGPSQRAAAKIAIVGGGMAGLAAAWRLSAPDGPATEITVYEQSDQLGGKGASGRGPHGRIEEHGLHVWLGYYDNAFRLIREVYDDLDRRRTDPDCPILTWRDAFAPAGRVGVEERHGRGWQHWVATFSRTEGEPGDATGPGGTGSPLEFVRRGVRLLGDFSTSLLEMRAPSAPSPDASPAVVLSGSPQPPTRETEARGVDAAGLLQQARFAAIVAAVEGLRLLGQAIPTGTLDALAEQLDRMRVDLDVVLTRGDPSLRRLGELADLVVTCCLGIVVDRLLGDPAGFAAIDDLDFRAWLRRHGARPSTLESALVRGMYDLVFAYADGDRSRPEFCAGLGLFLAGKFFFDYRGSLFWRMQAGMGDVVFAPLYQALRRRGVRFALGHRLDRIHLDPQRRAVRALTVSRVAGAPAPDPDPLPPPLIRVGGLPCFPASRPEPPDNPRETVELVVGDDFDQVVLAASLGSLADPCAELVADSPAWRDLLANVATVGTLSLQLWLRPSEAALGWDFPDSTVSGYRPPFDTYASMTHLLAREQWPARDQPGTLGYFCGSLPTDPGTDPALTAHAAAVRFLDEHAGHFWPAAVGTDGFCWELLVDGEGSTDAGPDRLAGQYLRANTEGSQRYVQSLPGTQRFRLRADRSGYANLVLAGDWTDCGLNAGCIEAAVLSGLQAANVVLGRPLLTAIAGTWYGIAS